MHGCVLLRVAELRRLVVCTRTETGNWALHYRKQLYLHGCRGFGFWSSDAHPQGRRSTGLPGLTFHGITHKVVCGNGGPRKCVIFQPCHVDSRVDKLTCRVQTKFSKGFPRWPDSIPSYLFLNFMAPRTNWDGLIDLSSGGTIQGGKISETITSIFLMLGRKAADNNQNILK